MSKYLHTREKIDMKYKIFIRVLLLLIVSAQTSAETPDGTIPFDCPDVPNPTFQFHFTRELITFAVTTAPFNSVDDLYIHIYDDEAGIYDTLAHYYGETLKAKNWHDIQEDERVRLYALNKTAMQGTNGDTTFRGIFAVVQGDEDIYLLNIVGSVPLEQMGQLLTDLGKLGIEIPELKSLPVLAFDEPSTASPTRFRTADGDPIHEVRIRGNQKIETTEILQALEEGQENLDKALDMFQKIAPNLPTIETPTQDIEEAVETLRKKMNGKLEKVALSIEAENGKHIAVITVTEPAPSRASGSFATNPTLRFNRVSGWKLGTTSKIDVARARLPNGMSTSHIFGYIGYGFGNKIIDYEIGIDTLPFATYTRFHTPETDADKWYHGFGINTRIHRTTDTTPDTVSPYRVPNFANDPFGLLYNVFGTEDLHNYYLRRGFEIGFRWQTLPRMEYIPPKHSVTVRLLAENHRESGKEYRLAPFQLAFNVKSAGKPSDNPRADAERHV